MKSKYLVLVPVVALSFAGMGIASAHNFLQNASPEEVAQKQQSMFEKKAAILGISVNQMKVYWAEGKSFKEIAELQGISEEDLRAKMQEARKARMTERLQVLVQQGIITQDQANQRLQAMESRPQKSGFRGFRGAGHHSNQEPGI